MSKYQTTSPQWLASPPMGWNSWDCFGATVREDEVLENAKVLSEQLLPYGWDTLVVDIQWSEPAAKGWYYNCYAPLTLDAYGRQLPAPNRFPSAKEGLGFKPLADQVHAMGLKFGVHLMRGIPRQAVHDNLPIYNSEYRAQDIVDTTSICRWNTDMYGVDASKPGALDYYTSVIELFASWGVDYIKVDDIAWNFVAPEHYASGEVALLHQAIARVGRPIFLSLSPGPADPRHRTHLRHYANSWRITDDFWDQWPLVERCIDACIAWSGDSGRGSWPDADMLPFGRLLVRQTSEDGQMGHMSHFTEDEEQLVLALWCLMRSPLMIGADLPHSPEAMIQRLQNVALLEWSQKGSASVLLSEPDAQLMVWSQEEALPDEPMVLNQQSAGPRAEGQRYPLLLLNRSEEVVEVELAQLLQSTWIHGDVQSLHAAGDKAWGPIPGETIRLRPHSSLAFVLQCS